MIFNQPPRNKGLIAGLIKGNQSLISPDHKALFLGGVRIRGGWLTSHNHRYDIVNDRFWDAKETFLAIVAKIHRDPLLNRVERYIHCRESNNFLGG